MRNISFLIVSLLSICFLSCKNRDNKQSHSNTQAETLLVISREDDGVSGDVISQGDKTIGNFHVKYCIETNITGLRVA